MSGKQWNLEDFKEQRPEIFQFVNNEVKNNFSRINLIEAPVKSGKRQIVQCFSVCLPEYKHVFGSAFHRTSDESQRKEFRNIGIDVFSITNLSSANECIDSIKNYESPMIFHLDECDYGSGDKQLLSNVWKKLKDKINIILNIYTATPAEFLLSNDCNDFPENVRIFEFIPPKGFCGPGMFLDANCVYDADPFFEKINDKYELSKQARQIILDFNKQFSENSGRNFIHLRLSSCLIGSKNCLANKMNHIFVKEFNNFPELADFILLADKGEGKYNTDHISNCLTSPIEWSNKCYWVDKSEKNKYIVLNDQTATRSTELECHDKIYCYHSFRNVYNFSVASQEAERYNHYCWKYNNTFQEIKIYGDVKCYKYSAGRISYEDFILPEWKLEKHPKKNKFKIISKNDESHPEYYAYMDKKDATNYLIKLHSNPSNKLTPRSSGNVKLVENMGNDFKACNRETYPLLEIAKAINPFIESDEVMEFNKKLYPRTNGQIGHLRGWQVLDYTYVVENQGCGMKNIDSRHTICYQNGVLGIVHRTHTNIYETKSTVITKNSMYSQKK